ncbi:hypothetical protein H4R18_005020, partial [Coemansia javaensis]
MLRSRSSSEKRASATEDHDAQEVRDVRRFSVAGPASSAGAGAGAAAAAAAAAGGQRKSHTPRSLHTWAEEDDEAPEGPPAGPAALARMGRLGSGSGHQQQAGSHLRNHSAGNQPARHPSKQGGGSVGSGSMYAKRVVPDGAGVFADGGSSSGSSNTHSSGSSSSHSAKHKRLRTPYSISIPSLVGSPLSFTQSFLASRTSMYAKHPPSSQIRAAHIDWDSLSMLEEVGWGGSRGARPAHPAMLRAQMLAAPALFQNQYLQYLYAQHLYGHAPHPTPPPQAQSRPQPHQPAASLATAHPAPLTSAVSLSANAHAAALEDAYAAMAAADEWGKQAAWDY